MTARAGELVDGTLRLLLRHPARLVLPLVGFPFLFFLADAATVRGPTEAIAFAVLLAAISFAIPTVTRAAFMPLLGEGEPALSPAFAALAPVRATAALVIFVIGLALTMGFAALILPGVLLAAFLVPASAVLVAEGTAPVATIARVRALVRGRYASLVGATLVPIAIVFASIVLQDILVWRNPFGFDGADFVESAVLGLGFGTAIAYWAVLSAVFYAAVVSNAHAPQPPPESPTTGAPPVAREPSATGPSAPAGTSAPREPLNELARPAEATVLGTTGPLD